MPYDSSSLAKKSINFGDGRHGSITYSPSAENWQDGAGVNLVNGGIYGGVSTMTLVIKVDRQYTNVTILAGATLQLGENLSQGYPTLKVCGVLEIEAGGVLTAGSVGPSIPGQAVLAPSGTIAKTIAGAGNSATTTMPVPRHGYPGMPGQGGGDGTNLGGSGASFSGTHAAWQGLHAGLTATSLAATTGAGANGLPPVSIQNVVSNYTSPHMRWPSPHGCGGASGALKQAGGANTSGAGGNGGYGKIPLIFAVHRLVLAAGAIIHNDGFNGTAGLPGVATNAAGDISGGGGGGGGGAGGAIACLYSSISDSGAIWRAAGGNGGVGGLGFQFNATARPTSNGGNGAVGTDGIIVKEMA